MLAACQYTFLKHLTTESNFFVKIMHRSIK